jgi:BMFP domain-containing protein YqiC
LKINNLNYETYKKIFEILWQYKIKTIPSGELPAGFNMEELSPIKILNEWEAESRSKAIKGLKAGLPDIIDDLAYNTLQEQLPVLDAELKANQLPGFFEIYSELKDTLQKVLKRQKILSLEEYYIVAEVLSDTTKKLTENDVDILNQAIAAFEIKQRTGNNAK